MITDSDMHKVQAITGVDIAMALRAWEKAAVDETWPAWVETMLTARKDLEGQEGIESRSDAMARVILHYLKES